VSAVTPGELRARNLRTLAALAALFLAPLVLAFFTYYGTGWRPSAHVNHGRLITPARPLPQVALERIDLGEGAPPGEYDVLIEWKQARKQAKEDVKHGTGHPSQKSADRLNGRYADPKQPRFHAVVKAETNVLPAFELTD